MNLTSEQLDRALHRCGRATIALVGDLFLDRYLEVEPGVEEYSIETGLEAFQVSRVRNAPGALGTVIGNLAAMGVGRLIPVTVIGHDGHGDDLLRTLESLPVDPSRIVASRERLTPTYTKPLKQNTEGVWCELNRLDVRTRGPLNDDDQAAVVAHLRAAIAESDAVIVLDQINETNWGVVNEQVLRVLAAASGEDRDRLFISDSRCHIGHFEFGVLKGNESEFQRAAAEAGLPLDQFLVDRAKRNEAEVYCTRGELGIRIADPSGEVTDVAGVPVTGPIDIVGAGDAATSGIAIGRIAGLAPNAAAAVGNLASSITVQQLGATGAASAQQLRDALEHRDGLHPQ